MSMINGIGTGYLGCADPRSDGSYVTTKWFSIVLPLIPLGSFRVMPQSNRSYLGGMYSSSSFTAVSVPLHWPHVLKFYGAYFAFYLFCLIADRMSTGSWHFS